MLTTILAVILIPAGVFLAAYLWDDFVGDMLGAD
jgi:uncharacterized membrane protein YqaE (UPF0057 family)